MATFYSHIIQYVGAHILGILILVIFQTCINNLYLFSHTQPFLDTVPRPPACHMIMPQQTFTSFIIVAFLENATIGYSLESPKSEYIVVYENSSDEFDIELHRIKVKVTVGVQKFSPFTTIQTVRSYSSTLVQARNLILSIYFI